MFSINVDENISVKCLHSVTHQDYTLQLREIQLRDSEMFQHKQIIGKDTTHEQVQYCVVVINTQKNRKQNQLNQ